MWGLIAATERTKAPAQEQAVDDRLLFRP